MFAAAVLRTLLILPGTANFDLVLALLAVALLTFIGSMLLAGKSLHFSALLMALEVLIIVALLLLTRTDFFGFLFAIVGMQAIQQYAPRVVAIIIALCALLTFLVLVQPYGIFQALALTLAFTAVSAFATAYIGSSRRAQIVQNRQQELVRQLRDANHQLEAFSQQVRQLAAERERQHLARELHDSVTQTIFSMTLTTQSALLLLDRDRQRVAGQLHRLNQLVQSALADIQTLVSELAPEPRAGSGFLADLQQHLADRQRLDDLCVTLKIEGSQALRTEEQASLFRIAQEALNNIIKHAGVSQATLRLHLADPFWMEIEDSGTGFDPQQATGGGQLGLAGMSERAAEIGWLLSVKSCPGQGTRIRVEKPSKGTC
jgi:signal transduction histidine kinase